MGLDKPWIMKAGRIVLLFESKLQSIGQDEDERSLFQIEREFELLYTENLALQEKLERANRQQQQQAASAAAAACRNGGEAGDAADGANASSLTAQQHAPSVKFQTQHSSTSSKVKNMKKHKSLVEVWVVSVFCR